MDFRLWLENYRGNHTPPGKGSGSPLHDLSDTYPDDIYGPNAVINYGTREPWDYASISIIQQARNRPNMPVKVYRAVPVVLTSQDKIKDLEKQKKYILKYGRVPPYVTSNMDKPGKRPSNYYNFISDELEKIQQIDEPKVKINNGDWVTINRQYAVEHGKGQLGRYRILSKTVKAKDLYTTGDSIHEWGYDE